MRGEGIIAMAILLFAFLALLIQAYGPSASWAGGGQVADEELGAGETMDEFSGAAQAMAAFPTFSKVGQEYEARPWMPPDYVGY